MSWNDDGYRPSAKEGTARDLVAAQADHKMDMLGFDGQTRVLAAAERQLRDGGIGVDLDVTGLSRLWTSVDFYLDLGVLQNDKRRKRLSPGRKNLLPDSKLASAQTRLRNNLYKYSHVVGILGGYRYIPDGAFLDWKERHDAIVAQFYAIRNDYIDRYDELVMALEEDYRAMAAETWDALKARGDAAEQQFTREYTLEEFQNAVVAKAMAKLPSPQDMAKEIHVVVRVATWMLPVEAAQDELERERLMAQQQAEEEKRRYWVREERERAEAMEEVWKAKSAEAKAKQAEAQAKQELTEAELAQQQELIEVETQAKSESIRQAQLELAREAVLEMSNPLDEMLNGLRDRMYDTSRQVLSNVSKNGRVVGKQVEAITNMIGLFRMLNSAGDDQLEDKINELAEAMKIEGVETKRDTQAIMAALNGVASVAMEKAETVVDMTEWTEWEALEL